MSEELITLIASNGELVKVYEKSSGMETGFARIGNPYWDGDPEWRLKDGDTVIGCEESDPRAMPVADAYQQFFREMEADRLAFEAEMELYDRDFYRELDAESAEEQRLERLYEIQDSLS